MTRDNFESALQTLLSNPYPSLLVSVIYLSSHNSPTFSVSSHFSTIYQLCSNGVEDPGFNSLCEFSLLLSEAPRHGKVLTSIQKQVPFLLSTRRFEV